MSINVCSRSVKSIIRKNSLLPDTLFVSKYSMSPYQGCEHACVYCDGRSEKYFVPGDFDRDIIFRENSADLFEKEIFKLKEKGIIKFSSGTSDVYQPYEKKSGIIRKCAEIVLKNGYSAWVNTKSDLIERDIDIWEKVAKKSGFVLSVSLTFHDDKYREIFEPGAASIQKRIGILKKFKEKGCYTCVLAMPFIPYISDSTDHFQKMAEIYKDLNVDFVIPGGLTLRPGVNKDHFIDIVKKYFPGEKDKILTMYSNERQSGIPDNRYYWKKMMEYYKILTEKKINLLPPHKIYKNRFPVYDEIYILLSHMIDLYGYYKIDIKPLQKSFTKYKNWLLEEKKVFNRKRNITHVWLEEKLLFLMNSGEFNKILENEKLYNFLKEVVLNNKVFDYQKRQLTDC